MACKCKRKVKELSKYSDEGADRNFEVGFLGKVWRILTGIVTSVFLMSVGICLFPVILLFVCVRALFGKRTRIELKRLKRNRNGRKV